MELNRSLLIRTHHMPHSQDTLVTSRTDSHISIAQLRQLKDMTFKGANI